MEVQIIRHVRSLLNVMERTVGRSPSDGTLHDESLGGLPTAVLQFIISGCDGEGAVLPTTYWSCPGEVGKP
jgi:hypothetical protein